MAHTNMAPNRTLVRILSAIVKGRSMRSADTHASARTETGAKHRQFRD
jgi:hypothetical protein